LKRGEKDKDSFSPAPLLEERGKIEINYRIF
jgi:hypothetical protein